MKEIKVACKGAGVLDIAQIVDFQGNLKRRGIEDIEKLKTSILKYGFSFPFFIWVNNGINYCFDGHGRLMALKELRKEGYSVPELPVVYVEAEDEEEARNKLLRLNSQYGAMSKKTVEDFMVGLNFNVEELSLPSGVLSFELEDRIEGQEAFAEYIDEENNYIVLKFTRDIDFINAQTLFGLETVRGYSTNRSKDTGKGRLGVGRVLDGVQAIEKLRSDL
jgi:hypothetical protein